MRKGCERMLIPSASGWPMLEARESVRNLPTYHPPLGGRDGLRLDFNENTAGCSPRVLARLSGITAEQIACYPERWNCGSSNG